MMSLQSHAFPIQFSLHDKAVYDSQKMLQIHTILLPCSSMNRIPSLQHCCAFDSRKDGSECIAIPGRAGVASRLLFSVLNAHVVRNQKTGPRAEEGVRLVWRQDELGLCSSDARIDVGAALVQVAQLG